MSHRMMMALLYVCLVKCNIYQRSILLKNVYIKINKANYFLGCHELIYSIIPLDLINKESSVMSKNIYVKHKNKLIFSSLNNH